MAWFTCNSCAMLQNYCVFLLQKKDSSASKNKLKQDDKGNSFNG